QLHLLGLVVMALVAVVTIAEQQPQALANDSIGLLVVLCGYLLMALILHRLMRAVSLGRAGQPLYRLLDLLVVLLPLAFVVAIGFGYYYTSLKLTDRLINTLYLVMLALMINALLSRGLSVAARRLAYARALAQRAAAPHGDSEEGSHESPVLDIEQVNQQSLRLIRLVLLGGFLLCLYGVWADLISVFTYLDQVSLYSYSDANGTAVPINLLDALIALLIALTTIVLARNLPGLLEVLVLSRLQLAQGSAYATTTLLTYAISAIGFVATLSVLGVSWDKLQWLVAALSVGIGFGMQEIFANFISGLIILFERPVRIGDVVTIGNLSGTVSKIRIRATTITDFDRKELIVPNKTFVTGQLVNWSLNDTVTRVIIRIGLAYESDLALARRLMLEAALDNERVLQEPGPSVYFLAISASTFDYELRFHVRELGDRNPATDEILTRIALDFREHGVDMAFNQLDVMVKNLENGQSLQVTSLPQPGSAPAPGDKPA
ncbi:TPA: mechanosensitive ion channel domain-containing protein, partial [Klebsiella pneumoniae]